VLWVIRECLSGLLARALLASACNDLAGLLREVAADLAAIGISVVGVVSDGQHSIRLAVAQVWPDVPHQLCHFHYLREAALPIFEADRHAKKELKKRVRGVRPIERTVEGRSDEEARIVQGYCAAVRSALTDDPRSRPAAARPPGGDRGQPRPHRGKGGRPPAELKKLRSLLAKGLGRTRSLWPDIRRSFRWVHAAARILKNTAGR
jgi:hypothetical protein